MPSRTATPFSHDMTRRENRQEVIGERRSDRACRRCDPLEDRPKGFKRVNTENTENTERAKFEETLSLLLTISVLTQPFVKDL